MTELPILEGDYTPKYKTEGAAAADLIAKIQDPITLKPLERVLIPTGLFMALPPHLAALLLIRSGTAYKKGLALVNGLGLIDSDYRGEVGALVVNLSAEEVTIEPRERIAQILFVKYETVKFLPTAKLPETERGAGGFGSTGKM